MEFANNIRQVVDKMIKKYDEETKNYIIDEVKKVKE